MDIANYSWIFGIGLIVAFFDAFGIGANDVANSFATSVASRSLSLKQACFIAVFTEFFGAFLLGGQTTQTIKSGILSSSKIFESQPEILMLGMACALMGSATWVLSATRFGWPVSTTHSIVGAIVGVGVACSGIDGLDLSINGLPRIVISWFVSPLFAGCISACIFLMTKYAVLVRQDSLTRGLRAIPVYFFIVFTISMLYLLLQSPKTKTIFPGYLILGSFFFGCLVFAIVQIFLVNWLRRKLVFDEEVTLRHIFLVPFIGPVRKSEEEKFIKESVGSLEESFNENHRDNECLKNKADNSLSAMSPTTPEPIGLLGQVKALLMHGINQEVADYEKHELEDMHSHAQRFDNKTEFLYSFLQIMTAAFASFAHGSNDVSNAVGPLSSIYYIYSTGNGIGNNQTPVPLWILAYGGGCIDLGLLLYGYNVMRSLGNKITYQSASRGFCAEFGTTLTVLTASQLGLPISTTHCITGATAAVGLCNDADGKGFRERAKSINWRMLGWCFFSWMVTLPIAGGISGLIFSFAVRSPKLA